MQSLSQRIRPEHEMMTSAILRSVRQQITFPDSYGVLLEGSVAEGLGTPGSDLDITIIPEARHVAPRAPLSGIFDGPHGPQIMDIEFKTVEQLTALAETVGKADVSTRAVEKLVAEAHRIHHGFPLHNRPFVDEIRSKFDRARMETLFEQFNAACARRCLTHAAAWAALDQPRLASMQARNAVITAAEAWLARRGETYARTKWLIPRLRRAGLGSSLIARIECMASTFYTAHCQRALDEAREIVTALGRADALVARELTVGQAPGLITWSSSGHTFLIRGERELYVLSASAASAWQMLSTPMSLPTAVQRCMELEVPSAHLGQLHRQGFLTLHDPEDLDSWTQSDPVVTTNQIARLTAHGVDLVRSPVAAVEAIPVCPKRLAGAGMMLIQGLIGAENAKEDALGACLVEEWPVVGAAFRLLAERLCRALMGSRVLYPVGHAADYGALFEQTPGVDGDCLRALVALEHIEVGNREDAERAYRALQPLLLAASALSDLAIERCYRTASDYMAALQLAQTWGSLGRPLGVPYPHTMGQRMLDTLQAEEASLDDKIVQLTSGGPASAIKVEAVLFERLFSCRRDLDLDTFLASRADG